MELDFDLIMGVVTLLGIACLATVIIVGSYRLLFHPLRKYPGPLLAKLSDAYAGWHAIKMDIHLQTRQDHFKHGPVMRYGPNRLIFSTPTAVQDIYNNDRIIKSHAYEGLTVDPGNYDLLTERDPSRHRFKRKLVGKSISERAMRAFEPVMQQEIDTFLSILLSAARASRPVNMTQLSTRFTLDTVALLAFGQRLNTQTDTKYRPFIDAQTSGNFVFNLFLQWPFVFQSGIMSVFDWLLSDAIKAYYRGIEDMIASRMAEEKHAREDLYSHIADDLNADGQHLQGSEIWAEASFFLAAGTDTMSVLISASLFYLSRFPHAYDALAAEIRSSFTSGSEIRGKLADARYLRAVIDETLRLAPPVPGTVWREANTKTSSSQQSLVIDGHLVPPGVEFGVNTYALHHNADYFPDPFAFRPERWLEASPAELRRMQAAFTPFGVGPRSCGGKAMAYLEASLTLAKMMWYFDFTAAPGKLGQVGGGLPALGPGRDRADEYQMYDAVAAMHDGPNLMLSPRKEALEDIMQGQVFSE